MLDSDRDELDVEHRLNGGAEMVVIVHDTSKEAAASSKSSYIQISVFCAERKGREEFYVLTYHAH